MAYYPLWGGFNWVYYIFVNFINGLMRLEFDQQTLWQSVFMQFYEDFQINIPRTSEQEYEVTKEAIIAFASEWDPVPFHLDEEVAKASPLGKLFASSIHTVAIGVKLAHTMMEEEAAIVAGLGWDELRFLVPVCVGDRLRVRSQLISKRESKSQPDRGILVALNEVLNQQGEIVASYKMSSMVLKRGDS